MRTNQQQKGNSDAQQNQRRGELLHSDEQNGSELTTLLNAPLVDFVEKNIHLAIYANHFL